MSSKAKRPHILDKLVKVGDLLKFNRAWLNRMEALEAKVKELEERIAKAD